MALRDQDDVCRRHQRSLAIGLGVAGLIAWVGAWRPMSAGLAEARARSGTVAAELTEARGRVEQLPRLIGEVADLRRRVDRYQALRPREEFSAVLKDLGDLVADARLAQYEFKPAGEKQLDDCVESRLRLTFEGDFADAMGFLSRLERMERLTRVRDVQVKQKDPRTGLVTVELSLSLFFAEG